METIKNRPTSRILGQVHGLLMASNVKVHSEGHTLSFRGLVGETRITVSPGEHKTPDGLKVSETIRIESVVDMQIPEEMECFLNMQASSGALVVDNDGQFRIKSRFSLYAGDGEDVIRRYAGILFFVSMTHTDALQAAVVDAMQLPVSKGSRLDSDSPLDGGWKPLSFTRATALLNESGAFANGDESGLTAEFPWDYGAVSAAESLVTGSRKRTSLLQIQSEEHPNLGKGLFCRLDLPLELDDSEALTLATRLNRMEYAADDWPPFLGAWAAKPRSGRPTFVSFWPDSFARLIDVEMIATWMAARAHRIPVLLHDDVGLMTGAAKSAVPRFSRGPESKNAHKGRKDSGAQFLGFTFDAGIRDNPSKVLDSAINQMKERLLALYDLVPEAIRKVNMVLYDTARGKIIDEALKYDLANCQVAGVMAVQSPQREFDQYVALTERTMDIHHNQKNLVATPAMFAQANKLAQTSKIIAKIVNDGELQGKRYSELTHDQKALFIRLYDKAYNDSTFIRHSSSEEFVRSTELDVAFIRRDVSTLTRQSKVTHKPKTKSTWCQKMFIGSRSDRSSPVTAELERARFRPPRRTGSQVRANIQWSNLAQIMNAISILEDGSLENISRRLGTSHKDRNLYNNVLTPNHPNGYVTVDADAVAAAHFRPLGPWSLEVKHNWGLAGAPLDPATGLYGTLWYLCALS